ncbi:hypothetical protein ACEPPN_014850 [Leptodophora sp. 'Broadleaf-Isolate-01']
MSALNPPPPPPAQPNIAAGRSENQQLLNPLAPRFGRFLRLPPELQFIIWRFVIDGIPPLLIEIRQRNVWCPDHNVSIPTFYSPCRTPDLLRTSRDAADELLRRYEWSFGIEGLGDRAPWRDKVLVNWEKDFVYFGEGVDFRAFQAITRIVVRTGRRGRPPTRRYRVRGVEKVQLLALSVNNWGMHSSIVHMQTWRSLKEVALVVADDELDRDPVFTLEAEQGVVIHGYDVIHGLRALHGWHNVNTHGGERLIVGLGTVEGGDRNSRLLRQLCTDLLRWISAVTLLWCVLKYLNE